MKKTHKSRTLFSFRQYVYSKNIKIEIYKQALK